MREINLYIDESGDLGTGNGRYFLICAIDVDSKIKSTIVKRSGRIINRFKKEKNISKDLEIKGSNLKEEERIELVNKIIFKGIKIRYVVLDLKHTTMLLKKADDKNACYNYLVSLLIKNIINDDKNIKKINIYIDNRSVKIGNRLFLKPYLYNKFIIEPYDASSKLNKYDFNVSYLDSKSCYLIQWADIISNSVYKKYNNNDNKYYEIINPYIIDEIKFPSSEFGK